MRIVGIGAALVDTELRVEDTDLVDLGLAKGLMTLCDAETQQTQIGHLSRYLDSAHRACGGSAANSIIAASQLGCDAFMTCKVADDEDGHFFLSDLEKSRVQYNNKGQKLPGTSGKCLVLVTSDSERTMTTCLGVSADLCVDNVETQCLQNADYLYIEGYLATGEPGKQAAIALRNAAKSEGVKIALSLSDPGIVEHFKPQLNDMIGDKIDLIFCNETEALAWAETQDLETAIQSLRQKAEQVLITKGAEGALCISQNSSDAVDAPKVAAIDSNGAGDMFAGCFFAALNNGQNFVDAARFACVGAAQVVAQMGPRLSPEGYSQLHHQLQSLA